MSAVKQPLSSLQKLRGVSVVAQLVDLSQLGGFATLCLVFHQAVQACCGVVWLLVLLGGMAVQSYSVPLESQPEMKYTGYQDDRNTRSNIIFLNDPAFFDFNSECNPLL
ncbi:hypothetical protein [Endozoicomonas numazuensis]|uniref:hypothetical protein n=1 Tax=Endozoicomonas numazuensis TaxID=1137799 RepID=UPI0012688654|nr:hypothetical protein [Endozoicomonas numazuensis]